jgi:aspartyl-tRNA synthetase
MEVHGSRGTYFLPQSAQVYGKLLTIFAFDRYFQFPHCFRDEDFDPNRTDQAQEFHAMTFEMRTKSVKEIQSVTENLVKSICEELSLPCSIPFPILPLRESMKLYKTDKPDLRKRNGELSFLWVVDFPLIESKDSEGNILQAHNPFALPQGNWDYLNRENISTFHSYSFDLVLNGMEIGSGDLEITDEVLQRKMFDFFGVNAKQFEPLLLALETFPIAPHGGFSMGFDRLMMQLTGANSIRDVNAF